MLTVVRIDIIIRFKASTETDNSGFLTKIKMAITTYASPVVHLTSFFLKVADKHHFIIVVEQSIPVFTPPKPILPPVEAWIEDEKPVVNDGRGVDFAINPYPVEAYAGIAVSLFATLAVATMMVWVRVEAVALDQAEWCSCASSTVTMRIVQSRLWPNRQPFVEDPIPSLAMTIDETESQEVEHAGVQ